MFCCQPINYADKSNRTTSAFRTNTEPDEILFQTFHQNSQVQSVDLNDKLERLLRDNSSMNQKLSRQIQDSQIISQANCTLGIDFDQLFARMETLENLIEHQHMQIVKLKQQNSNTEKHNCLIASFIEKNQVYQEMIFQQQQEIENYKRIVEINANLVKANTQLQKRMKELENLVEEYQVYKIQIESKVYNVIEQNKQLQVQIEDLCLEQSNEDHSSQILQEKDQEIESLQFQANQLRMKLQLVQNQNNEAKDLKYTEIKQYIQSQRETPSSQQFVKFKISEMKINSAYGQQTLSDSIDSCRTCPSQRIDFTGTLKRLTNIQAKLIQQVRNIE